ncbi:MAG TPA: hypothetical protein VF359_08835 [Anaerolineales bacterium]|jgi:hypothetical protein
MDVEQLEKRLEFWKQGLLVALGASVTFLAATLAESPRDSFFSDAIWGWYLLWVVIWLAVAPPGFYLLLSRKWRKVPLSSRLNTAFGYLGCAWLVLLSSGIMRFSSDLACNSLIVISAFALGMAYWYLRKKKDEPEEIFP